MIPRISIPIFVAAMAMVGPSHTSAIAQDSVQSELAQLRKLVEQQNTKIDTLSAQIARLSAQLDAKGTAPAAVATAPASPAAAAAAEEFAPTPRILANAPKVHIVVKGEALEKIAKQHGITVAELQKLNNITDPKKLQVGQQLTLPPEKKE
jgi:LysM repeat protein